MESYIVTEMTGATFAAGSLLALDEGQLRRRKQLVEAAEDLGKNFTACRALRPLQFKHGETVRLIEGPEVNKRLLETVAPKDSGLGKAALAKAEKIRADGEKRRDALAAANQKDAEERAAKKALRAPGAEGQAATNKQQRAEKPKRESKEADGTVSVGEVPTPGR